MGLIRFVLAACVACFHLGGSDPNFGKNNTWFGGTGAVVGFLFISGFSIAWSLEQRPQGFLKRRFLRIYPVYAFSIALPWALGMLSQWSPFAVLGYFFFLQGVVVAQIRDVIGVSWSLAAEWWLYVLAPKLRNDWALWAALFGMPLVALYCALFNWRGILYGNWGIPIVGCAPFWLGGFAIARYSRHLPLLLVGLASAILTFCITDKFHLAISAPVTAVTGLLAISFLPAVHPKLVNVCDWFGEVSYPLYLVHMMLEDRDLPWYQAVGIALTGAILVNEGDKALKRFIRHRQSLAQSHSIVQNP